MPFVYEGEEVRLYHDDGSYSVGEVKSAVGTQVVVDFDDWVEEFTDSDLGFHHVFLECREVLTPIRRGVIVKKYRS